MTDLLAYLHDETLPDDRNASRWVARRAKTFVLINSEMYKRNPSETGILMKCVPIA